MMWRNSRENGGKSTVKKKFWKSHEKVKSGSYTGGKKNADNIRSTSKMPLFYFMWDISTHG